jgi:hypothetical protein
MGCRWSKESSRGTGEGRYLLLLLLVWCIITILQGIAEEGKSTFGDELEYGSY